MKKEPVKPASFVTIPSFRWQHVLLIALIGFAVYANSLNNRFVYDDTFFISKNDFIKDLHNLPSLLRPGRYFKGAMERGYWPVVTLSYMLTYPLWGLNVVGYHLTNIIFHIFNALLLYLIILKAGGRKNLAAASALLFVSHPIHTESVAWISARTDVFSCFFFLSSFFLYTRAVESEGRGKAYYYTLSILSFIASLFSKEISITLPLVIVLYDFLFGEKERIKKSCYAAYFLVALLYLVGRAFIYARVYTDFTNYAGETLPVRLLTMTRGLLFYMKTLLAPFSLSLDRMFPVSKSVFEPEVLLSMVIIAAVAALTVRAYKKSRGVFFSLAFFLITLLPVSNIIPIPYSVVAERYMYIPSIGFCILLGLGIEKLYSLYGKRASLVCLVAILALYSVLAIRRNADWRDGVTLWTRTLEQDPANYRAHYNLGVAYTELGKWKEGLRFLEQAVRLKPDFAGAHNNLGAAYDALGRYGDEIKAYKEAINLNPNFAEPYYNLGAVYFRSGLYDEAMRFYKNALNVKPDYAEVHYGLGMIYARLGRYEEEVESYKQAVRVKPSYADAYYNLGVACGELARYEEAAEEFRATIKLKPAYAEAHYNLGMASLMLGDRDCALKEYEILKRLDTTLAERLSGIGER